jgi:hypothetical protein
MKLKMGEAPAQYLRMLRAIRHLTPPVVTPRVVIPVSSVASSCRINSLRNLHANNHDQKQGNNDHSNDQHERKNGQHAARYPSSNKVVLVAAAVVVSISSLGYFVLRIQIH